MKWEEKTQSTRADLTVCSLAVFISRHRATLDEAELGSLFYCKVERARVCLAEISTEPHHPAFSAMKGGLQGKRAGQPTTITTNLPHVLLPTCNWGYFLKYIPRDRNSLLFLISRNARNYSNYRSGLTDTVLLTFQNIRLLSQPTILLPYWVYILM